MKFLQGHVGLCFKMHYELIDHQLKESNALEEGKQPQKLHASNQAFTPDASLLNLHVLNLTTSW